ncbi:sensor histidine kinase [Culicoidibacter larvae]|uniref:histidine kinase n=1 Tax=Culicoidibacter larvae TaxID=2579976 RepID=A0A5R8QBM1_9FIRM|nr:ATP-binding protein [Culicoidibacter larvae]TLG72728.1 hypothetical protein FEZ08_08480 [Culicoidibacter larvae]
MNKKLLIFVPVFLAYAVLVVVFILMILQIGSEYQRLESGVITDVQSEVSLVLNEKSSSEVLATKLSTVVNNNSMELIVLDGEQVVFTTFPGVDITNIRDLFNGDEVLYKSQGIVNTVNGDLNVMMVIYHVSMLDYLNSMFIWLTIFVTVLFLLLIVIVTLVNRMLFKPLRNIRKAINEMKDFDVALIEDNTAIGTEFNQFVHRLDETLQNVSKQYTDLELLLLFERQRLDFLLKIARGSLHELKTPLYQTLLQNQAMLRSGFADEELSQLALKYNITQNDKLLKRINVLLRSIAENVNNLESGAEFFDAVDLFYEVEKDFEVLLEQRRVYLDFSSTEKTLICMNRFALQLVIHNLISNAVKYAASESDIEFAINVENGYVQLICINRANARDIERLRSNRFTIELSDETYSSGNGVYLVQELSKSLGGKAVIDIQDDVVEVVVTIPEGVVER